MGTAIGGKTGASILSKDTAALARNQTTDPLISGWPALTPKRQLLTCNLKCNPPSAYQEKDVDIAVDMLFRQFK